MASDNNFENLLVSTDAKQPWPVNIYQVSSGSCVWSYKGSELNNEAICQTVLVADEYLYTPIAGRPVISHVSLQSRNRAHFRSFTPGIVQCLATTSDGSICSGAVGEKIYTWSIGTGALLSVVSGHYQAVTKMKFTTDGSYLISCGKDGRILAWNLVDLLTTGQNAALSKTVAVKNWSAHSLPGTDLKLGSGGVSCRIFTVSSDQTAKVHSLSSGQLLLSLLFDCALSACAVDNGETRFFAGTTKGDIFQVNLFAEPVARERQIQTSIATAEHPIFSGHKEKVTELDVNVDGTVLASGSDDHTVRLWHILSRQCLRTISCAGKPNTVQFLINLPVITEQNYVCSHPVQPLKKQFDIDPHKEIIVRLKNTDERRSKNQKEFELPDGEEVDHVFSRLREEETLKKATANSKFTFEAETDQPNAEDARDEDDNRLQLKKARRINDRLYNLLVEKIFDKN